MAKTKSYHALNEELEIVARKDGKEIRKIDTADNIQKHIDRCKQLGWSYRIYQKGFYQPFSYDRNEEQKCTEKPMALRLKRNL